MVFLFNKLKEYLIFSITFCFFVNMNVLHGHSGHYGEKEHAQKSSELDGSAIAGRGNGEGEGDGSTISRWSRAGSGGSQGQGVCISDCCTQS